MKALRLAARDVVLFEPKDLTDESGCSLESVNRVRVSEATGKAVKLVQDNSRSLKIVLSGLCSSQVGPKCPQGLLFREVEVCA